MSNGAHPVAWIMTLEGWDLPDFESDLEPRELKRILCRECAVAWADVQCHLCDLQYCNDCEDKRHSAVGDPDAHREQLEPCNVCGSCQVRSSFLYCRECEAYLCDTCCSTTHSMGEAARTHVRLCTEGAPSSLLRYNTWSVSFKERVKMARYKQYETMETAHRAVKQEAGALPDYLPLSPTNEDDEETSDEEDLPSYSAEQSGQMAATESVQIKMERVRLSDQDTGETTTTAQAGAAGAPLAAVPDVPEVVIKSEPRRPDLEQRHQPSQAVEDSLVQIKTERRVENVELPRRSYQQTRSTDVVDLTGDDDGEGGNTSQQTVPNVKTEPTATATVMTTIDPEPVLTSAFAEEDPFRTAMIEEYNKQSKHVAAIQQHIAGLSQHAASTNVHELLRLKQQHESLKNTLTKAVHSRNATVARLLVYLHGEDVTKLVAGAVADIPQAQDAFHRLTAEIQTKIDAKLVALHTTKRQLEEAISMKSTDAYAEVRRLGVGIAELKSEIQRLETERLDAFRQLCAVSQQVRTAILSMLASTSGAQS